MNDTAIEAEKWFSITRRQADELLAQQGRHWPFENVTIDQFYLLVETLTSKKDLLHIIRIIGSVVPAFGIVFTLLLIGTFWRKTFSERNTFFSAMMVIAILDLQFNILDMIFNICYRQWKVTGFSNSGALWLMAAFRGLAYTFSLASDIFAVCVTIERYLAIGKPHFHRNLSIQVKRNVWKTVSVITFLLSITRMHYTMAMQVEAVGSLYFYTQSRLGTTRLVVALAVFSDTVIPMILILIMCVLSTKFLLVVIKVKIHPAIDKSIISTPNLQTNQCDSENQHATIDSKKGNDHHGSKSIVLLTVALDVLLVIDNLGYILYFVAEMLLAKTSISYDSDYEELSSYCGVQNFENYASLTAVALECLTRAINFPIYIALSSTMRQEFLHFVKKLMKR